VPGRLERNVSVLFFSLVRKNMRTQLPTSILRFLETPRPMLIGGEVVLATFTNQRFWQVFDLK